MIRKYCEITPATPITRLSYGPEELQPNHQKPSDFLYIKVHDAARLRSCSVIFTALPAFSRPVLLEGHDFWRRPRQFHSGNLKTTKTFADHLGEFWHVCHRSRPTTQG